MREGQEIEIEPERARLLECELVRFRKSKSRRVLSET